MKPTPLPACVLSLIVGVGAGCRGAFDVGLPGSGTSRTESRDVASFSQLSFVGAARIEFAVGPKPTLQITADDNLIELIETIVIDGVLQIRPTRRIAPKTPIVIKIVAPDLSAVETSGAAELDLAGIANERLALEVNGAGSVVARGTTGHLDLSLTGAARALLGGLAARDATLTLTGAGSADVHVAQSLNVTITGAGIVTYSGDARVTQQVFGAGSVKRRP